MRSPPECCQIEQDLRQHMPHLTKAQTRGLAEWTCGTVAARSGCLTAVVKAVAALTFKGRAAAIRQRLRERLLDGADRARPFPNQIDVRARFVPLMRRALSLWKSDRLALALAPTTLSDKLTAVVVSVVYRGCAVPVARVVLPGNKKGGWIDPAVELLKLLSVAIPTHINVILMADRGLRSPRLWKAIRSHGWRPVHEADVQRRFPPRRRGLDARPRLD